MNTSIKRTGLVSAIVALASVAACSNKQEPKADASLKADLAAVGGSASDLQLAPSSAKSSVVVSEIEGGPKSAPTHVATVRAPRPVQHKAPPMVAKLPPVSEPAPVPVAQQAEPAPVAPAPEPTVQAPAPAPTPAPRQDHRVYKTEGEIFRQMPWIRP
jgi:hypothetical protein